MSADPQLPEQVVPLLNAAGVVSATEPDPAFRNYRISKKQPKAAEQRQSDAVRPTEQQVPTTPAHHISGQLREEHRERDQLQQRHRATVTSIALLRSWFPLLKEMSDRAMSKMDLATLTALNASMQRPAVPVDISELPARAVAATAAHMGIEGQAAAEDPNVLMAKTLENLSASPTIVPAKKDDRLSQLHSARVLGGPVCNAKQL